MSKKTLFLAGDSTVQSYPESVRPQTGWGQVLWEFFKDKDKCNAYVRPDAPGEHCVTYEMPEFKIENHAIAARSSRSFIEQGRLDEIMKVAKPGDYLTIQFAHNDAYKEREERYVPVSAYGEWIKRYYNACRDRGMTCIFITPVTMRVFDGDKCLIAFKEYRDEMLRFSKILEVPCVDLSKESTDLISHMGSEAARDAFLWLYPGEYPDSDFKDGASDNAHFQEYGARLMASIVAKGIKGLTGFEELKPLQEAIGNDFRVERPKRTLPDGFTWTEGNAAENAESEIIKRE
ncbi:MAG: rhamnogalacturonan acetylesterase [Lachnospiraceae bacterium]|nr:rhamnogalacturonan acetylesterase [Lachnospiraceae bacterium]